MILGMLGFGIYLGAAHSVRQLASDVARATIPGASEEERQVIASNFIVLNVGNYAFIEIEDLEISVRDSETAANQFVVEISYDASGLPIWGLSEFAPMPSKTITASATIVNGGYVQ
jgi:Flp pilus assembly protein TadG